MAVSHVAGTTDGEAGVFATDGVAGVIATSHCLELRVVQRARIEELRHVLKGEWQPDLSSERRNDSVEEGLLVCLVTCKSLLRLGKLGLKRLI